MGEVLLREVNQAIMCGFYFNFLELKDTVIQLIEQILFKSSYAWVYKREI